LKEKGIVSKNPGLARFLPLLISGKFIFLKELPVGNGLAAKTAILRLG